MVPWCNLHQTSILLWLSEFTYTGYPFHSARPYMLWLGWKVALLCLACVGLARIGVPASAYFSRSSTPNCGVFGFNQDFILRTHDIERASGRISGSLGGAGCLFSRGCESRRSCRAGVGGSRCNLRSGNRFLGFQKTGLHQSRLLAVDYHLDNGRDGNSDGGNDQPPIVRRAIAALLSGLIAYEVAFGLFIGCMALLVVSGFRWSWGWWS
jgi:hypothetical protein